MKKILVIDDDDGIREMLTILLEFYGYEVQSLSCGEKVLQKLKHYRPDMLLMDIMLGDADGREICKSLKINNATAAIPVVLMSASHEPNFSTGMDGPDGFIEKPFELEYLLNRINHFAA